MHTNNRLIKLTMQYLNKFLKINSSSLTAAIIFFLSIAYVIKHLQVPNMPATSIILDLAYGVLLSIIASIIFYYALVYLPELYKMNRLKSFIAQRSWNIVGDAHATYMDLAKAAGVTTSFNDSTKSDIDRICSSIHPLAKAPLIINTTKPYQYAHWFYFLVYRKKRTEDFSEKLFKYIIYLDVHHIKHLTDITDCSYFMLLEMFYQSIGIPHNSDQEIIGNKNISFISSEIYAYFTLIKEFERYLRENFAT